MFRNAMLPQLTGLALALGSMVGGALIAENDLQLPGLGMAILHGDPGQRLSSHHRVHVAHYGVGAHRPTSRSTSWLAFSIRVSAPRRREANEAAARASQVARLS